MDQDRTVGFSAEPSEEIRPLQSASLKRPYAAVGKTPPRTKINYPKKRVSVACELCRSRKTRCDARRPSCGFCSRLAFECVYRPSTSSDMVQELPQVSSSHIDVLSRLDKVESLLHDLGESVSQCRPPTSDFPGLPHASDLSPGSLGLSIAETIGYSATHPAFVFGFHLEGFSRLASFPCPPALELLQAHDHEEQLEVETGQAASLFTSRDPSIEGLDLTPRRCWQLQQSFMAEVLPWAPIMDQHECARIISHSAEDDVDPASLEMSISLFVLALGSYAQQKHQFEDDPALFPGIDYFRVACRLADCNRVQSDTILYVQCHILMAIYFQYCLRPFPAFEAIQKASHKVMMLLSRDKLLASDSTLREHCHRAFWTCYLIEYELQAYVSYSARLIQERQEYVPLPVSNYEEPGMYWFLSEIAMRRIFSGSRGGIGWNAQTVYTPIIADEINAQLLQWHESLAQPIQFALEDPEASENWAIKPLLDPRRVFLRAQFYAVEATLHWSYVVRLLSLSSAEWSSFRLDSGIDQYAGVEARAKKAVNYAILHVNAVEVLLQERHPMLLTNITGLFFTASLLICAYNVPELAGIQNPRMKEAGLLAWRCLKIWNKNPGVAAKLKKFEALMSARGYQLYD